MNLDFVYQMLEQAIHDARTAGLEQNEVVAMVEDVYNPMESEPTAKG